MNLREFKELFQSEKPMIGMVHLMPLPGSPRYHQPISKIIDRALNDARILVQGGMDGLMIENYGDAPFHPTTVGPETIASITWIVREIQRDIQKPLGINVLRNDSRAALAIATVLGCDFIRVNVHIGAIATDQGVVSGRAFETLRYRSSLASQVKIFADIFVKHGTPLGNCDIGQATIDTVYRGLADAAIVTGKGTGEPVDLDELITVKTAMQHFPILAGSGINESNLHQIIEVADGAVLGTSIKKTGKIENPVDIDRVKKIVTIRDQFLNRSD